MSNTLSRRQFLQTAALSAVAYVSLDASDAAPPIMQAKDRRVQAVLDAVYANIRTRYKDKKELADGTIADLQQTLGHHSNLRDFVFDAQTEAITNDVRTVVPQLPFRMELAAILREADHVRCRPVRQ